MPSSSAPIAADTPATPAASASTRRWEIDALRGLMLVLMTVTHIPTRFSDPFGQPLGYVSAAEGFVMLSAYVAGMVYTQRQLRDGAEAMRSAFLRRAFKIYLCQAVLLVFLLGLVAVLGVVVRQAAITDMVSFFLDHPLTAFFSGLLLLYNPPLFDILPMYVVFMVAGPVILLAAARRGWSGLLLGSGALWLATQFGLSQAAYDTLVHLTGMPVPFRETGSFEILAWQFLWIIGMWIGAGQAAAQPVQPRPFPRWAVHAALVFVVVHLVWRHAVGQVPFPGNAALNALYDKWQLGPMRLLNFMALMLLAIYWAPLLSRSLPRWRALECLGRQSLPVFCAHLVLASFTLVSFGGADVRRPWLLDITILATCFAVLWAVALVSERIDRHAADARTRFSARRAARRRRRASAQPGH